PRAGTEPWPGDGSLHRLSRSGRGSCEPHAWIDRERGEPECPLSRQRHHRALCRIGRVVAHGASSNGRKPAVRLHAATLFSFCLIAFGASAAGQITIEGANPMTKSEDVRVVAPALEKYAQEVILGDLWKRAGLSPRDRSIVAVSALIARDQTVELPYYLNL